MCIYTVIHQGIVLCFTVIQILHFFFFFNKLKACGNPALSKSFGAIFFFPQQPLLTLCFWATFRYFSQYFKFSHYYYSCYGHQ